MTKIIEFIKLHYLMHHSTLQCTMIYLKRSLGALKLYSKINTVKQIKLKSNAQLFLIFLIVSHQSCL